MLQSIRCGSQSLDRDLRAYMGSVQGRHENVGQEGDTPQEINFIRRASAAGGWSPGSPSPEMSWCQLLPHHGSWCQGTGCLTESPPTGRSGVCAGWPCGQELCILL